MVQLPPSGTNISATATLLVWCPCSGLCTEGNHFQSSNFSCVLRRHLLSCACFWVQVLVWNLADADGGALLARVDPDAAEPGAGADAGRPPSRLGAQLRLKVHLATLCT